MAIRPNGFVNAPAAPKTKKRSTSKEGGTPRGWTFISTAYLCWRRWFYSYVLRLYPVEPAEELSLGSAYHALLEGDSPEQVLQRYPKQVEQALSMFKARMERGGPIPEAETVEEQVAIFDGKMTSKPDRVEVIAGKKQIRDYKSALFFSEHDEAKWNVDGGIIGEMVAAGTDVGIVDIQRKRTDPKDQGNDTRIVKVELTPAKRQALEAMVRHFWAALESRIEALNDAETSVAAAFQRNLTGCVGKYGPCPYYARCWGTPPASLLYKSVPGLAPWAADLPDKAKKLLSAIAKRGADELRKDPSK